MPSLRTEIKIVLILALWLSFCAGYFSRFPIPAFLANLYFLSLAVFITGSAFGFGSFLIRRLSPSPVSASESVVISTMAGFGILSLLMMIAGALGLWVRLGAVLLVGTGLLLAWTQKEYILAIFAGARWDLREVETGPLLLISTGAILSFLAAWAPPIYYDSLVYHYALPQAYILAKHWIGQTTLIYSAFPQMLEMLWTLGMLMAGDIVANFLGWIIAALGVAATYLLAKRLFGPSTGAWAAAFLSMMPAYLLLSSGGYIDVGLAVFSILSFYMLCLWEDSSSATWLGLAGFFAGCAMGTKYTGAIPFAIGGGIVLLRSHSQPVKQILGNLTRYAFPAFVVFAPWLLKNIHYVGNPVFPFFYSLSPNSLNPWVGQAASGYFRGLTEYAPRMGGQTFKLLWDIAVNGLNFGGGMDVLGDMGWAPLFVFLPAIGLVKKRSAPLSLLLIYAACFYVPWAMSRPVLRLLIPLAPFLAILAAYGFDHGVLQQTRGFRFVGQTLLLSLVLSNGIVFFQTTQTFSLFNVPLGLDTRAEYLSKKLTYFTAASYINTTLPIDSLTFVVGDQCGYYYNRPVIVTPVFNKNPLTEWANDASSPEDLLAHLREHHLTHLLVNYTEMKRLDKAYHLFPFSPVGAANWNGLLSRLVRSVHRDRHCEVFSLS